MPSMACTGHAIFHMPIVFPSSSSHYFSSPISTVPLSLIAITSSAGSRFGDFGAQRIFRRSRDFRVLVQQTAHGSSAVYAKDMERLSAKESLHLAFQDSGGFEALITGRATDMQRIDVNEKITGLERLNPTPRPTMSPFLEGRWNIRWFGSASQGLSSARLILKRFPSEVVNLTKVDAFIKDGSVKITANIKLFGFIESKFRVLSKLSVEGPIRMKEEYVDGVIESPSVIEDSVPQQLRGLLGQAAGTMQRLPAPIKDSIANGLTIPLSGSFQRFFMIPYLDEEILIIRDAAGVPEVLTRSDNDDASVLIETDAEYES